MMERLTDFSQHLEEVGQSSLLLLQDVLHLRLLLLFLRRRVHAEALQVAQPSDDLTLKEDSQHHSKAAALLTT